jgi:Ras-related protein Rap-1B
MQLVRGVFVETYDPTLEDSFIKVFPTASSGPLTVEILDTAGTDQFEAMRDMYIGSGDAFVLVYAVDSKASFNEVVQLIERIKRLKRRVRQCFYVHNFN